MRVKYAQNAVLKTWKCLGPPPAGTTIDLNIALKPHNENALIDALYEHFLRAETNETLLRKVSHALPAVLHVHVQTAVPLALYERRGSVLDC
ncbi:hypothetical protein EDB87DRAFT_1835296 [Lactarius vividus]|nr:hypothetical protein EDB87DRAFT_1835296 [Lactarius vividus]